MRKITEDMVSAIAKGKEFKRDNTEVRKYWDGSIKVYLHDNLIATLEDGELFISDAGWQTVTTKERLNGILDWYNLGYIMQKNFTWYFVNAKGQSEEFKGKKGFQV